MDRTALPTSKGEDYHSERSTLISGLVALCAQSNCKCFFFLKLLRTVLIFRTPGAWCAVCLQIDILSFAGMHRLCVHAYR